MDMEARARELLGLRTDVEVKAEDIVRLRQWVVANAGTPFVAVEVPDWMNKKSLAVEVKAWPGVYFPVAPITSVYYQVCVTAFNEYNRDTLELLQFLVDPLYASSDIEMAALYMAGMRIRAVQIYDRLSSCHIPEPLQEDFVTRELGIGMDELKRLGRRV